MSNLSGKFSALAISVAFATLLLAMSSVYVPTFAFWCTCVVEAMSSACCWVFLKTVIMTMITNSNVVKSSLRTITLYFRGSCGRSLSVVLRCF